MLEKLIVNLTVYPQLVVNYDFSYISSLDSLNLESQNQAKNIPEFSNQNLRLIGQSPKGLWFMIGQTKKPT